MGKALLIIVMGAGMVMARHFYSSLETEAESTRNQVEFQEETVAREIARSAFNNAMGVIRSHGEDIDAGVLAAGGVEGRSGQVEGGEFRVRAEAISGHSVRVTATGYYGGAFNDAGEYVGGTVYTMHDTYRVPVLISRTWSSLEVDFHNVGGSYCAAIYYQEVVPGRPLDQQPAPRLLFASDNRDHRTLRLPPNLVIPPNTQMNFLIAVDQSCRVRPDIPRADECAWRRYIANHTFNPAEWDYVRPALLVDPLAMQRTVENPWALVEQNPDDRQRWRIGWEDLVRDWDRPDSDSPTASLQATKRLGYDGRGWLSRTAGNYRTLQNLDRQPDFDDQLIEVRLVPLGGAAEVAAERCRIAAVNAACGVVGDVTCTAPGGDTGGTSGGDTGGTSGGDTGGTSGGDTGGGTSGGDTGGGGTPGGDAPPTSGAPTSSPPTSCPCPGNGPNNRKVAVMHRPPGNEANEHVVCVAAPAAATHLRQHNDYVVCTGN